MVVWHTDACTSSKSAKHTVAMISSHAVGYNDVGTSCELYGISADLGNMY
jgi:hypothetical protein